MSVTVNATECKWLLSSGIYLAPLFNDKSLINDSTESERSCSLRSEDSTPYHPPYKRATLTNRLAISTPFTDAASNPSQSTGFNIPWLLATRGDPQGPLWPVTWPLEPSDLCFPPPNAQGTSEESPIALNKFRLRLAVHRSSQRCCICQYSGTHFQRAAITVTFI